MRWILAVAVAVPGLLLAAVGLTHPGVLDPGTAHHWWTMHVLLLPLFPLLAVGFWALLSGVPGPLAWAARIAGYGYAAFYTALDVLAGIAAGAVTELTGPGPGPGRLIGIGDQLGQVGSWCFLAAAVLTAAALAPRGGWWLLPGLALLLVSGWLFMDNHIFRPYGVLGQVGIAVGTALLALAVGRAERHPAAHRVVA